MSRKGGYKIIDLKGLDFSSNMVIDGIHESIEDNYGKPLLFSGIVIDGVEKDDVFTKVVVNGNGYDVTLYGQMLHISHNDVVRKVKYKIDNIVENLNALNTLPNGTYDLSLIGGVQYALKKYVMLVNKDEFEEPVNAIVYPNVELDDADGYIVFDGASEFHIKAHITDDLIILFDNPEI